MRDRSVTTPKQSTQLLVPFGPYLQERGLHRDAEALARVDQHALHSVAGGPLVRGDAEARVVLAGEAELALLDAQEEDGAAQLRVGRAGDLCMWRGPRARDVSGSGLFEGRAGQRMCVPGGSAARRRPRGAGPYTPRAATLRCTRAATAASVWVGRKDRRWDEDRRGLGCVLFDRRDENVMGVVEWGGCPVYGYAPARPPRGRRRT